MHCYVQDFPFSNKIDTIEKHKKCSNNHSITIDLFPIKTASLGTDCPSPKYGQIDFHLDL